MKLIFYKKRGLTIVAALTLATSIAQTTHTSSGNTEYETIINDPDKLKPILIGFNALAADTWNTNSYMGIGVFTQVNILKYGSVNFDWKKAYFDGIKGLKNHRGIELGFAYNLFSSKTEKDLQVVLASSLTFTATRRTSSTRYITVPGTKKRILQIRGGLTNLKTGVDSYDIGTADFSFNIDTAMRVQSFISGMKMNILYSGISWHTINNLVIKHGSSGLATNCNDYNFFFDLLFMPSDMSFENTNGRVRLANGGYQQMDLNSTTLNTNAEFKKTGWRMGWEARKNNIMGGFTYKVELGARPGLTNSKKGLLSANSFMMLTAGFTFPAGNKKILNY